MSETKLIEILKVRLRNAEIPENADLSGTPFTRFTVYEYNDKESGAPFKILRLGNDTEELPNVEGKFWEVVVMNPGLYPPHIHHHSSAQLVFVSGQGEAFIDRKCKNFTAESVYDVPAGMSHGFRMKQPCLMLSIQSGKPIVDPHTGEVDVSHDKDFEFPVAA
jgi:mannose-6-phosphate isomerase-like protein (cupin superfamily)